MAVEPETKNNSLQREHSFNEGQTWQEFGLVHVSHFLCEALSRYIETPSEPIDDSSPDSGEVANG